MATHQLAQFCQDLRPSHEQATTCLGRYLAHTKDRGIVYEPDNLWAWNATLMQTLQVAGI